jgi:hypothetical protein
MGWTNISNNIDNITGKQIIIDESNTQNVIKKLFIFLNNEGYYCFVENSKFYIYEYHYDSIQDYTSYATFIQFLQTTMTQPSLKGKLQTWFYDNFRIKFNNDDLHGIIRKIVHNISGSDELRISDREIRNHILGEITKVKNRVKKISNNVLLINDKNDVELNLFKPSKILQSALNIKDKIHPTTADFKNLNDFLETFTDRKNEEESYHYLINYLAYWIQNLGLITPQISFYMCGAEGTGKGTFVEKVLFKLLNPVDYEKITINELERFNHRIANKYLIFLDEAVIDKRMKSILKNIIGNERVGTEAKNKDPTTVNHVALWMIAKNEMKDSVLDTGNNRRYSILYNNRSLEDRWGYEKTRWFRGVYCESKDYETELINFAIYLLQYKIDDSKIIVPLENTARSLIKELEEEKDMYKIYMLERFYNYMEDAIMFNEQELNLNNKKKLKMLYLWKEQRFLFNAYNIRQDLATFLEMRKSEVTQYLFDHLKFVYLEPENKHITTYDGINAVFFKVDLISNQDLYRNLESLYNKKIQELNKLKEDIK